MLVTVTAAVPPSSPVVRSSRILNSYKPKPRPAGKSSAMRSPRHRTTAAFLTLCLSGSGTGHPSRSPSMERFDTLFAENPDARVLVDRFTIPLPARGEFEAAMSRNAEFLSGLPGFLGHL